LGGISPVTKDFINPEAAWPQIARLQAETESRGFVLRERLALYPNMSAAMNFSIRASRQAELFSIEGGYPVSGGIAYWMPERRRQATALPKAGLKPRARNTDHETSLKITAWPARRRSKLL